MSAKPFFQAGNTDSIPVGATSLRDPGAPTVKALLSDEHFSVDGTLIGAWVSMKSFKSKDGGKTRRRRAGGGRNTERDFHGEKRTNAT